MRHKTVGVCPGEDHRICIIDNADSERNNGVGGEQGSKREGGRKK